MMYCLTADIERRIGSRTYQLLSQAFTTGESWENVVNATIEQATGIVNSYLMKRYEVPVGDAADESNPVPQVVRDLTIDVAVYLLYRRAGQAEKIPDIRETYERAINRLKDIARGIAEIPAATKDSNHGGAFESEDRVFTVEEMRNF